MEFVGGWIDVTGHSQNGKMASPFDHDETPAIGRQPIVLLADSQLLFHQTGARSCLADVRNLLAGPTPHAAYIGASNDDMPEFFDLFRSAMAAVGIVDCKMIRKSLPHEDAAFLEDADLVLLAGGDEPEGWRAMRETGLDKMIVRRYHAGALLMGVSAGAVQMGLYGEPHADARSERLGLVPFLIDVHQERNDWERLKSGVRKLGITGLGVPSGGGAFYTEDCAVEPIRYAVTEVTIKDDVLRVNALLPP